MIEILEMEWGAVTPEFFSSNNNSAIHVFNHSLIDEDSVNRSIRFAIGRIEWYKNFLPQGCGHVVIFDDRGQNVGDGVRNKITDSLKELTLYVKFMSKGDWKNGI